MSLRYSSSFSFWPYGQLENAPAAAGGINANVDRHPRQAAIDPKSDDPEAVVEWRLPPKAVVCVFPSRLSFTRAKFSRLKG